MEPTRASSIPKERRAQNLDEENVLRQKRSRQLPPRCARTKSSISTVAATRRGDGVRQEPMPLLQKKDLSIGRPKRVDLWDARSHSAYRSSRRIERTSIRVAWTTSGCISGTRDW